MSVCLCVTKNEHFLYRSANNEMKYKYVSINTSKHLKGQLDPPVGNGNVFWIKGGQLASPVGNVTFFGSKEVSWTPLLVT